MIYALIIYLLTGGIFSKKSFLKSQSLPLWVKIFHLIITLALFEYYFDNFRVMLWNLFRHGFYGLYAINKVYAFSKSADLILAISFFLVSGFVSGLALNLSAKCKSRKLLLMTSPLIILVTSLDLYRYGIVRSMTKNGDYTFFWFTLILITIGFGLTNLFYNIKPGKNIFKTKETVNLKE